MPDPFWFLRDQDAFVKRFVLSQVLSPPPSRRQRPPRPAPAAPKAAPSKRPAASKKK